MKRLLLAVVFSLACASGCAGVEDAAVTSSADLPARSDAAAVAPTAPGGIVPDARLTNQSGHPLSVHGFSGQVVVTTFIFTRCPMPEFCPRLMRNFQELRRELSARPDAGANIHLLAVSIDPEYDTPDVLRAYGKAMFGSVRTFDRLDLATGAPAEVARLATSLGLRYEPANGQIVHSMTMAIVGADGRLVKRFDELTWNLKEAMPILTREAARASRSKEIVTR